MGAAVSFRQRSTNYVVLTGGYGTAAVENLIIFYGKCDRAHRVGTSFCVSEAMAANVSEFISVNGRILILSVGFKKVVDAVSNKNYRRFIRDMNAKDVKEQMFYPITRSDNLHEKRNDNALKFISFQHRKAPTSNIKT